MDNFIDIPNLPNGRVSLAIIDGRIPMEIERKLYELEIKIIKTEKILGLYEAVSYHPDIMLHHLGGDKIVVAPNINSKLVYELENNGFNIICGKREVGTKYPWDVPYNAARVGNNLICNIKYTDDILLENIYSMKIKIINVNQGYTKCSICIVDNHAIITSDYKIYKTLIQNNIECCLINSGGIELFNMNYGFIGGSSGLISSQCLAFFGDLYAHNDYEKIIKFLIKYNKKKLNLSEKIINDFGSLIPLKEYSIMTK